MAKRKPWKQDRWLHDGEIADTLDNLVEEIFLARATCPEALKSHTSQALVAPPKPGLASFLECGFTRVLQGWRNLIGLETRDC